MWPALTLALKTWSWPRRSGLDLTPLASFNISDTDRKQRNKSDRMDMYGKCSRVGDECFIEVINSKDAPQNTWSKQLESD